jgi:hypothetical protein
VLKVQSTGPLAEIAAAESFLRTRNNVALEERFENELTPNHSVASATRMASAIFSHYQNGRRSRYVPPKEDLRLNWNRDLFYRDLMDAVLAVFLHNIVPWMSADELKNCGWCSPNDYPALTYLLLLCDVLVEWDKPKAHDGNPPMRGSDVRLEFDQAGSAKLFYPAAAVQKAAEVGDKLQNCFGPEFNHVRVEAGR